MRVGRAPAGSPRFTLCQPARPRPRAARLARPGRAGPSGLCFLRSPCALGILSLCETCTSGTFAFLLPPSGLVPSQPGHPSELDLLWSSHPWSSHLRVVFALLGVDFLQPLHTLRGLPPSPSPCPPQATLLPFPLGVFGQKGRPPVLSLFSVSPQILRVIFTKCTRP